MALYAYLTYPYDGHRLLKQIWHRRHPLWSARSVRQRIPEVRSIH